MRAAVIGTGWGLVHCYALREAGVQVEALGGLGRQDWAQLLAEHQVAQYLLPDSPLPDVDLWCLAVPAESRLDWLRRLPPTARILSEKPLLLTDAWAQLPGPERIWVNYAFAFLDTAQQLLGELPQLGALQQVHCQTRVALPGMFELPRWLFEAASHPASFLVHALGPLELVSARWASGELVLELWSTQAQCPVRLSCGWGDEPGLSHRIELTGQTGQLSLAGQYRPGQNWYYEPLMRNQQPLGEAEHPTQDGWLRANYRAIAAWVDWAQGRLSREQALARGLFDAAKAWQLESVLQQALAELQHRE